MSDPRANSGCPPPDVLESFAAGTCHDAAAASHIEGCRACQDTVAEIRQNQRFLADFLPTQEHASPGGPEAAGGPGAVQGYELLGELKRGGQGVVYKAVQKTTNRKAAIKMPLAGSRLSPRDVSRFQSEITLVARMRHPYIVTVYDSGVTADGGYFVAMEYVNGVRLDEWGRGLAQPPKAMNAREAVRAKVEIIAKVCDAVQYAHTRGIMHRDLKPGNIMVDRDDNPRLLDFGIARRILQSADEYQTMTGQFIGTLAYASPEQVEGDPDAIDTRTDVYSLGLVLYELLTGRLPYPVDAPLREVIKHITETEAARPSELPGGGHEAIGNELETILLMALAKERDRRYQTAAALGSDLRHLLSGEPIDAKRDSTLYMLKKAVAKNRGLIGLGATAVGLIIAISLAFAAMMTVQNRKVSRAYERLAESQRETKIETGHAYQLAGRPAQAELNLWPALLETGVDAAALNDATIGLKGPPEVLRPWWELSEVYSRSPCVASRWAPGRQWTYAIDVARNAVLCRSNDGDCYWWYPADGATSRHRQLTPFALGSTFAVSVDGKMALSAGIMAGPVGLFDLDSGQKLVERDDPDNELRAGTFSPDGRRLACVGKDGTLRIFQVPSLAVERAIPDLCVERCEAAVFSPDGKRIAAKARAGGVHLFDTATGVVIRTLPGTAGENVAKPYTPLVFAPDGRYIAQGNRTGGVVQLWDTETTAPPRTFTPRHAGDGALAGCIVASGGTRLATWGADSLVKVWDMTTAAPRVTVLEGCTRPVNSAQFMPGGEMVVTGDEAGCIKLWETRLQGWLQTARADSVSAHDARFGPSGMVATAGEDGVLRLFDTDMRETTVKPSPDSKVTISSVAFSADGRLVACARMDGTVWIVDRVEGGQSIKRGPAAGLANLTFSPDSRWIVAGGRDGEVWTWEVAGGEQGTTLPKAYTNRVITPAFSPDGLTLVTTGSLEPAVVWDWSTRARRATLTTSEGPNAPRTVRFSPDGSFLLSGGNDGLVRAWDPRTGALVREWRASLTMIFSLAIHPDGVLLATGDRDGVVRLWDLRSGKPIVTLVEASAGAMVFSVDFSADGRRLACLVNRDSTTAGGEDPTSLRVWDLTYYARHIAGNYESWAARASANARDDAGQKN